MRSSPQRPIQFPPRPGCIGKPVPGFEIGVIDAAGNDADGEGDIAIRRGAGSMMLEYWNRPEATAEKFRGDWMLTGDRGCWEAGYLRFVGRDDDVITTGGYRVGPAEIEDNLMTHPAVATAGVVGKPDRLRTEIVKAYVVLKSGAAATEILAAGIPSVHSLIGRTTLRVFASALARVDRSPAHRATRP